MAEFAGARVVVVGGAGSIGSAIARAFGREGAVVVVWDRPGDALDTVTAERAGSHAVPVDLLDEDAVAVAAQRSQDVLGGVDVLVNAAGLLRQGRITEMSAAAFDEIMGVNVRGPFLAIKHIVPLMPSGSSIVNLSSVSAYAGSDGSWAYTTTKGALSSLTFGVAQELGARGIRVNAICPGWVDGGFTDQARASSLDPSSLDDAARNAHVLGRMAQPDEVAEAALFLASPRRASFVTGTELFVDGGFMIKR